MVAVVARLLALSLAVSVASRFVHYYALFHPASSVGCNCVEPKRQDLERDAAEWTPPAPKIEILYLPVVHAGTPEIAQAYPETVFLEFLYDRPPPAL